jgi:hypothetical protein
MYSNNQLNEENQRLKETIIRRSEQTGKFNELRHI